MTCHTMTTAQVCEPGRTYSCNHTQQIADTDPAVACTHWVRSWYSLSPLELQLMPCSQLALVFCFVAVTLG